MIMLMQFVLMIVCFTPERVMIVKEYFYGVVRILITMIDALSVTPGVPVP